MSKASRKWSTATAAAVIAPVVALVLMMSPAHSDDETEHQVVGDNAFVAQALANWDDEVLREQYLAAYLGLTRDDAFAPFEDPSYVENL